MLRTGPKSERGRNEGGSPGVREGCVIGPAGKKKNIGCVERRKGKKNIPVILQTHGTLSMSQPSKWMVTARGGRVKN